MDRKYGCLVFRQAGMIGIVNKLILKIKVTGYRYLKREEERGGQQFLISIDFSLAKLIC